MHDLGAFILLVLLALSFAAMFGVIAWIGVVTSAFRTASRTRAERD